MTAIRLRRLREENQSKRWREERAERSIWWRSRGRRRGGRVWLGLHLSTQHPRKPTAKQQPAGGGGRGGKEVKMDEEEPLSVTEGKWKRVREKRNGRGKGVKSY